MNIKTVTTYGKGHHEIHVEIAKDDKPELKKALAILKKYKLLAFNCFEQGVGYIPTQADWHSVDYQLEKDFLNVIIEDGICG